MARELISVAKATRRLDQARKDRDRAVDAAVRAGLPVAEIGRAARTSHGYVRRMAARARGR